MLLYNEVYLMFVKLCEIYLDFYEQILLIWLDVVMQECYWKDWDWFGIIVRYLCLWQGVVQFIYDIIEDLWVKKQVLKVVVLVFKVWQVNVCKGCYGKEENGGCYGYLLLCVFKFVVSGFYIDGIQLYFYLDKVEIFFEKLIVDIFEDEV